MTTITKHSSQRKLESELSRLKKIMKMGSELKVKWIPNINKAIAGEVKNSYILLYDEDLEIALEMLRHEFMDYAVSRVVEPYKAITNQLIAFVNENAYRRKERLVDSLAQLLIRDEIE